MNLPMDRKDVESSDHPVEFLLPRNYYQIATDLFVFKRPFAEFIQIS